MQPSTTKAPAQAVPATRKRLPHGDAKRHPRTKPVRSGIGVVVSGLYPKSNPGGSGLITSCPGTCKGNAFDS